MNGTNTVQAVSRLSVNNVYVVTFLDGTTSFVPQDPQNADYAAVQAWVAEGGTITDS